MFKKLLIAVAAFTAVVSAKREYEVFDYHEHPQVLQANWNVAGTKALVKEFEGLYLKAYKCPAGVWTIGWGHTSGVREGMTITR